MGLAEPTFEERESNESGIRRFVQFITQVVNNSNIHGHGVFSESSEYLLKIETDWDHIVSTGVACHLCPPSFKLLVYTFFPWLWQVTKHSLLKLFLRKFGIETAIC